MNALAWLNDLMTALGKWIPRLELIPATHRAVRFGPRGGVSPRGPGLIIYWPILQAVVRFPVTTQSIQLSAQIFAEDSQNTIQGFRLPEVRIVAAAVQFRIVDPVKAALGSLHLHALVDNRTSAAIARHAKTDSDPATWMKAAASDAACELEPYGVKLERLDLTQNGSGLALKQISDWNYADSVDGSNALQK